MVRLSGPRRDSSDWAEWPGGGFGRILLKKGLLDVQSLGKPLPVEVVDAATAEAFADALEHFFARRGVPSLLLSDNGSNFKGYYPEIKKKYQN